MSINEYKMLQCQLLPVVGVLLCRLAQSYPSHILPVTPCAEIENVTRAANLIYHCYLSPLCMLSLLSSFLLFCLPITPLPYERQIAPAMDFAKIGALPIC